jgi:hypothetical protein
LRLGARPTPKAQIARRWAAIWCKSNDDGLPMSVSTPDKALRIMGCDTGPAATTARTAASTLPNEEGAFDGNISTAI